jgi:hypothetical protein
VLVKVLLYKRSWSRSVWDSVGQGTVKQRSLSRSNCDMVGQGTVIQKVMVKVNI